MKQSGNFKRSLIAAACSVCMYGVTSQPALAALNLPPLSCGLGITNNCLQFDDFQVLSLGLLQYYQKQFGLYSGYSFLAKPNEASLYVTRFSQGTALQGPGTNIDDRFDSLTGSTGTNNGLFLMVEESLTSGQVIIPTDPGGGPVPGDNSKTYGVLNAATFVNQPTLTGATINSPCTTTSFNAPGCMQSWDASIADLQASLAGSALVAMFQFNETGTSATLDGQDLVAWARVTLSNPSDSSKTLVFDFSGGGAGTLYPTIQGKDQQTGVDDILPTANDRWAYVHSEICVNKATGAVFLGACASSGFGADGETVNQSLGADEAGFAIYNETLDMLVRGIDFGGFKASDYTVFSLDLRLGHLNDGGDNLWFGAASAPPNGAPEPGALALVGLGLVSLVLARRRRSVEERI